LLFQENESQQSDTFFPKKSSCFLLVDRLKLNMFCWS